MIPALTPSTLGLVWIRLSKWLSKNLPDRLVHRILVRRSTIPQQLIFQEAVKAADRTKQALDIGANRGTVSDFLARHFPVVHSFEPNVELAGFLKKVLPRNCTVHPYALSNEAGEHELSIIIEQGIPIHGRGRILEGSDHSNGAQESRSYATQKIRLETLDDQNLQNIGMIKIDVEGHEENVIRGGLRTLQANKPVMVIEIEKRHTGKPVKDTIALIESLGFTGYFFEEERRRPASEFQESMQDPTYPRYINDFLFLPR
jgi:FkbM family methyltransferase